MKEASIRKTAVVVDPDDVFGEVHFFIQVNNDTSVFTDMTGDFSRLQSTSFVKRMIRP